MKIGRKGRWALRYFIALFSVPGRLLSAKVPFARSRDVRKGTEKLSGPFTPMP